MATVGQRFKTGEKSPTKGKYTFDGYTNNPTARAPTAEEQYIELDMDETFPPIKSTNSGAYWKLTKIL
ncbi:YjzC family protein [Myxococcus qinghaiensis]|uniref:YjzC family protein n=1 Tax=Myxococcus qinghaiensis TaxID=2906758 RepID=UPI0020A6FCBE|nr:YjzC family protein [Myxococcus qinghaiensis]MCP3169068.1 YjzC family protein [Myxococcus qinghaiensis]